MKNALILHGAGNDHTGNWFPWLKTELENLGYKVWSPDLPDSDIPNKKNWLKTIFANKEWIFDSESIIVGHSAGSTLILRILEELPEGIKINKAILVAGAANMGTKPEYFNYKRDLTESPFNWPKIKRSCNKFYFIGSDNDPYQCGYDQSKIIYEHIGGEIFIKKGQGHFNLEKGPQYKKFPFLMDLVK
jgi:predicted alpha/beta hydrolase family esterase